MPVACLQPVKTRASFYFFLPAGGGLLCLAARIIHGRFRSRVKRATVEAGKLIQIHCSSLERNCGQISLRHCAVESSKRVAVEVVAKTADGAGCKSLKLMVEQRAVEPLTAQLRIRRPA